MNARNLLIPLIVLCWSAAGAGEPSLGPVIKGYGPTYDVAERDVALPPGHLYKVVFDIAADPEPAAPNRHLVSVARFLNMHARSGVAVGAMELAVVVHGPAINNLLRNEAHFRRRSDKNPNLGLVRELQEAGVRFYVCGQSMVHAGLSGTDFTDGVDVALSAMTMLSVLQADGFALLPWGAN